MTNDQTTSADAPATLSSQRAFVVHLGVRDRQRRFSGRVEHLSSGQSTYFSSLGGLLAFFTAFVDTPRRHAPLPPRNLTRR